MNLGTSRNAQDVEGFVLAGGKSTRMGSDKALVRFAGRPLIEHALHILRSLGIPASIAGAHSALDDFAPVIPDSGLGPLSGVCAALERCKSPLAVLLSVDMPVLPPAAITCMLRVARIEDAGAVFFTVNGFIQTFPAVLEPALLPALSSELRRGHGGCLRAIRTAAYVLRRPLRLLPAEVLAQAGQCGHSLGLPSFLWFLNVNTPHDLAAANRLLSEAIRVS